jgi:hypothetical protein
VAGVILVTAQRLDEIILALVRNVRNIVLSGKIRCVTDIAVVPGRARLVPVLRNGATIGSLVPADNAGLGLARAVSVVSVLRQSKLLAGYKIIPLSGAQLVNTDETLALAGTPGDIRERRRIEIRLRKSNPQDSPIHDVTGTIPEVPLPRPKPKPWFAPRAPFSNDRLLLNRPLAGDRPRSGSEFH